MKDASMTARISAFSRAYHFENNEVRIFEDSVARTILTDKEYHTIGQSMKHGIVFFNRDFKENEDEALRWIVDNQLSPTPLARAAFAEKNLEKTVDEGVSQYLLLGAGFDTLAYRQEDWAKKLNIMEVDHPLSAEEKQERLKNAHIDIPANVSYVRCDFTQKDWTSQIKGCPSFKREEKSFCSMLGLIYYLSKGDFTSMVEEIRALLPKGSYVAFDYPSAGYFNREEKHSRLAKGAGEAMNAEYEYGEMKSLLEELGYEIIEHLNNDEMTVSYFEEYNRANPNHKMKAQVCVSYCLCKIK